MDYQGLTATDLANIRALNRCFLKVAAGLESHDIGDVAGRRLTRMQLRRLAATPFLLFSFREHDSDYWIRLLDPDPQIDFGLDADPPADDVRQLQIAGLGFLWQLSCRNPYAARVVSGAPLSWCERLAAMTLVDLLSRVAIRGDLITRRFMSRDSVWRRLLVGGVSSMPQLRTTSQLCALQVLLTSSQHERRSRVPAAACSLSAPARQLAGNPARGIGDTKV